MRGLKLFGLIVVIVTGASMCAPAFAQSEKIGLRMIPQPNQVVKMKTVQETEVEMTFEGNAAQTPVTMVTKTIFAVTQKSGAISADGRIEAAMTYDELSFEVTMNGQVMPTNSVTTGFLGKTVSVTFDKEGAVVDIKVPGDSGVPEAAFRQMLMSMYGNMPALSLAVGETATVPLDFTLPLPLPGAPPLKMDGEVKHKLVSVEKAASGRVANFDHSIAGKLASNLEMPVPNGNAKASLDFTLNGGGTMMRDLDRGVVKSMESAATFVGTIKVATDANLPQMPSVNLRGKTKTTTTAN